MTYLCKFDENGKRSAAYPVDVDMTPEKKQAYADDGYIPISDEDYQHYIGNRGAGDNGTGYIRDAKTGKPVSAPPAPAVPDVPAEPVVDDVRLAAFEAMAAQEERMAEQAKRIAELETMVKAGKGGEGK